MKTERKRQVHKKEKKKEPGRNRTRRRVVLIIIILVGITVGASIKNIVSLEIEHKKLEKENTQLKAERKQLELELKNVNSKEYIEEQARQQLRLVNPDEILFVFPTESGDSSSSSGE